MGRGLARERVANVLLGKTRRMKTIKSILEADVLNKEV